MREISFTVDDDPAGQRTKPKIVDRKLRSDGPPEPPNSRVP
jgi:hypothetical protein